MIFNTFLYYHVYILSNVQNRSVYDLPHPLSITCVLQVQPRVLNPLWQRGGKASLTLCGRGVGAVVYTPPVLSW